MSVRATSQTLSQAPNVIGRSTARRAQIGAAAVAASLAIAFGVVLATDGDDGAGSVSQGAPAARSVAEHPNIDAGKAAENFHHRR